MSDRAVNRDYGETVWSGGDVIVRGPTRGAYGYANPSNNEALQDPMWWDEALDEAREYDDMDPCL